jgi:hypothetical protein
MLLSSVLCLAQKVQASMPGSADSFFIAFEDALIVRDGEQQCV